MIINLFDKINVTIKPHSKFRMRFAGLHIDHIWLIEDWTTAIDFLEFFNSYQKNHLKVGKVYILNEHIEFELHEKDKSVYLAMYTHGKWHYFEKVQAAQIVHKMNRILSRCDLFLE